MNKITETKPTTAHALTKLRELIAKSAGLRHSIALLALGLLLTTVPRVTAQTKLSVADNDFVLAAAQGGMIGNSVDVLIHVEADLRKPAPSKP